MLHVVVKESEWLQGEGGAQSLLHRAADGKKCCLGFACLAAGVPLEKLTGVNTPAQLSENLGTLPAPLALLVERVGVDHNSYTCERMMNVNDAGLYQRVADYATKKQRITELGATVGLQFEFVP
jgi:hypothetical protein